MLIGEKAIPLVVLKPPRGGKRARRTWLGPLQKYLEPSISRLL